MKNNEIEQIEGMTKEECREGLYRIIESMDDIQLLRHFYLYAVNRIKRDHTVDCGVSCPDYRDLIVEMMGGITNQGILEYLHTFIKLFLEKWG